MRAARQRSSPPYYGSPFPEPSRVSQPARGGGFRDVPTHSEPRRKDRTSLYASQLGREEPGQQEPRIGSSLVPSWQRHSSDANIGRGVVYPTGGGIPREGLSPSPRTSALRGAQR